MTTEANPLGLSRADRDAFYEGFRTVLRGRHPSITEKASQAIFLAAQRYANLPPERQSMAQEIFNILLPPQRQLEAAYTTQQFSKSVEEIKSQGKPRSESIQKMAEAMVTSDLSAIKKENETCTLCGKKNTAEKVGNKVKWLIRKCCAIARYCSTDCQRKDLQRHQIECLNPRKANSK